MTLKFRLGRLAALSICLVLGACGSEAARTGTEPTAPTVPDNFGMNTPEVGEESLAISYQRVANTIHFETDSYAISPQSEGVLQAQAGWLQAHPVATITVEGHADERGTREYNLALAEQRANAAAGYLAALGIDAGRLSILSYGKERPACGDGTDACWAENRRAVSALNPQ